MVPTALVALPESSAFALYGLHEVFVSAGRAWTAITGERVAAPTFGVAILAAGAEPFRCGTGMPVVPDARFAEAGGYELVIVPDLALPTGADPRGRWPEATAFLRAQYAAGATICSVCSGALALADAGLLEGTDATTHWAYAETIRRFFPSVRLSVERILVAGGEDRRILTAGGAAAWEDLALLLVARFCGAEEASRIRRLFLFGDRTAGQAPFSAMVPRRSGEDRAVAAAQLWLADNYAVPGSVAGMVAAARLPRRTFDRRFRAATGYSPAAYVKLVRVEEAKQLLERTAMPVDDVAAEVGYADPAHFRRTFRAETGITPADYRRRFRLPTVIGSGAGGPVRARPGAQK